MKKLSNRLSVKQSSTKEGQRELLREHTNKINEIIDYCELLETYIKDHNTWHYTEKPYTAMRSTGECICKCHIGRITKDYPCSTCWGFHESQAHEPQEYVREKILHIFVEWKLSKSDNLKTFGDLADRILAIVKGE